MTAQRVHIGLCFDADVLIDYSRTSAAILTLASQAIATGHVSVTTVPKVVGLDEARCRILGLIPEVPDVSILLEAARRRGKLSFDDHVCLLLSKANGWTCVSNDKALRRACQNECVPTLWGLDLMVELVRGTKLAAEEAIRIAKEIQGISAGHVTPRILAEFEVQVRQASGLKT